LLAEAHMICARINSRPSILRSIEMICLVDAKIQMKIQKAIIWIINKIKNNKILYKK